jgi:hypothetical protein
MSTDQHGPTASAAGDVATWIPPLELGDRLTRDEFERRYRIGTWFPMQPSSGSYTAIPGAERPSPALPCPSLLPVCG